jgi:hypothetical protein
MATTKLTQEEIDNIANISKDNQVLRQELGKLGLDKIELESRETNLKAFLANIREREAELNKALTDKYGAGTVDLQTGEITTQDEQPAEDTVVKTQPIEDTDEDN